MRLSALTRSRVAGNYALITPESHVVVPLPGWKDASGVVLISPRLGAGFTQYLALMARGGRSALAPADVERFVFVLEGSVQVEVGGGATTLQPGGYAYLPPESDGILAAAQAARVLVFERPYLPLEGSGPPGVVLGREQDVPASPFLGDPDAPLKTLLPDEPAFDMGVNLFAFMPGGSLPLVEVHVMEHGALLLDGQGIYRLGDDWHPVQAGDAIWMGPYCPQWFAAIGKIPARYIYYKNSVRDAW